MLERRSILDLSPEEYAIRKEEYAPTDPALVQSFDSLFQSPDYLMALGKAHAMPKGTEEREDAERGQVSFEKNGQTWVFKGKGNKKISRITQRERSTNDFYGEMTFDAPVMEVRITESAEVDPGKRVWEREINPYWAKEDGFTRDGAFNDLRAIEKVKALIDAFNADVTVEVVPLLPAPEAVVFVSDKGRLSPESRFISPQESWDTALKALKADNRVSPNSRPTLIREKGKVPYIHVFTADYYRTPSEELVELARSFPEVDIRFSWYQGSGREANRLLGLKQPPFEELYPKGSF